MLGSFPAAVLGGNSVSLELKSRAHGFELQVVSYVKTMQSSSPSFLESLNRRPDDEDDLTDFGQTTISTHISSNSGRLIVPAFHTGLSIQNPYADVQTSRAIPGSQYVPVKPWRLLSLGALSVLLHGKHLIMT